jgi:hypothetical protein
MNKIWCVRTPVFGGVLLMSAISQTAMAAESPASQPAPTPGIATPDQAVRQMATNMVLNSRSSASVPAPSISQPVAARSISSRSLPSPSSTLSNCPSNSCGFIATQPPVSLGSITPIGKAEQNRIIAPGITVNTLNALNPPPQPVTHVPSEFVENAAKISLNQEAVDIKDGGKQKSLEQIAKEPTDIATQVKSADKSATSLNFQQQIFSIKDRLVESSRQFITVLPKPQIDTSLLNIGGSGFQPTGLSFSPRLTLGNIAGTHQEPIKPISTILPVLPKTIAPASKSFSILPLSSKVINPPNSLHLGSVSKVPTLLLANFSNQKPERLLISSAKI